MDKETVYVETMGGGYCEASEILGMIEKLTDCLKDINSANEARIEELEDENSDLEFEVENLTDENDDLREQLEELEGE